MKSEEHRMTSDESTKSISSMKWVSLHDKASKGPLSQKKWLITLDLQYDNRVVMTVGKRTKRKPPTQLPNPIWMHTWLFMRA